MSATDVQVHPSGIDLNHNSCIVILELSIGVVHFRTFQRNI